MVLMKSFEIVKESFDEIYGSLSVPVFLFDDKRILTNANQSFRNLTKADSEQMSLLSVLPLVEQFKERDWTLNITPNSHVTEIKDRSGNSIPVIINYKILKGQDESYCGGLGFVTDLRELNALKEKLRKTIIENEAFKERQVNEMPDKSLKESKRLEQEVKESKEFLENVVESCGDGICIVDATGNITQVNRSFANMLGKSKKEFEGIHVYELWPLEGTYRSTTGEMVLLDEVYHDDFLNHVGKRLLRGDGGKIENWEVYAFHSGGDIIPIEMTISIQRNSEGVMTGGIGSARDITERKRAEREIEEAHRFRRNFITNMTHEFRTPLTLAIGPMETILRGELGEINKDIAEQLSIGLRNSRQLLKLVNQLLDYSRLESGARNVVRETKNLKRFSSAIVDLFSPIAKKKKIDLNLKYIGDVLHVSIDPGKLEKVLFNIIGNAFKFTSEKGKITVTVEAGGEIAHELGIKDQGASDCVKIQVSDTGIGIKEEDKKTIFNQFQQAGNGSIQERGTGIGLAHAKELVELMDGKITVDSDYGVGTTFSVILPVEREQLVADAIENEDMEEKLYLQPEVELSDIQQEGDVLVESLTGKQPLILVVDDNRDVLQYIISIIKKEFDFITAASGKEGLLRLNNHLPDVILSDLMMPEMDGYEFLKNVKSNPGWQQIPFVFLTARADIEMKIAGLEEGADDYIVKPFNALELLARVRSLLRIRELLSKTEVQEKKISTLTQKLQGKYRYGNIIGNSPAMRKIYQMIDTIKESDANVLVTGETGTGKELIANAIHYNSRRKMGPLVSVNCGAIPRELVEREFFGHVKGAYTGAVESRMGYFLEADKGTLFLDEIGEMDNEMQVKLLRVLETGEIKRVGDSAPTKVNVRLVAATNKNLLGEVQQGNFREDLYYRIHVIPVHLPPLRQRVEDIPLLVDHFIDEFKSKNTKEVPLVTDNDMQGLMNYRYPGNVRELEHIITRFCLFGSSEGNLFEKQEPIHDEMGLEEASFDDVLSSQRPLKKVQEQAAKALILHALKLCGNNYTEAANMLNIGRSSLYRKIKEYGLEN